MRCRSDSPSRSANCRADRQHQAPPGLAGWLAAPAIRRVTGRRRDDRSVADTPGHPTARKTPPLAGPAWRPAAPHSLPGAVATASVNPAANPRRRSHLEKPGRAGPRGTAAPRRQAPFRPAASWVTLRRTANRSSAWRVRSRRNWRNSASPCRGRCRPIANYVPYVVTGNLVVVSGQVPAIDGKIAITGKVSWGVSIEQGEGSGAAVLHQRAGASEGGLRRRPRPGEAGGAPGWLHRRARPSSPSTPW